MSTESTPDTPVAPVQTRTRGPNKKSHKAKAAPSTMTHEQLLEIITALQTVNTGGKSSEETRLALEAITQLKGEVERTVLRSNKQHPGISVFDYPEGRVAAEKAGKIKKLTYKTYFCGGLQFADDLTPTEVDLYNSFTSSKSCRDGRWTARLAPNGTTNELHIDVPCFTTDERMSLPSLVAILGELLYGAEVVDPATMMQSVMQMQKRIAELEAAVG